MSENCRGDFFLTHTVQLTGHKWHW